MLLHKIHLFAKQQGLTLIELMIVLLILTILMLIGTALSRTWVDRSQVNGAVSSLNSAISQAKSAALRNTNNQLSSYAAASICYDQTSETLNVVRAAQYATNVCLVTENNAPEQNYILKTIQLPPKVTLRVDKQDFECLGFNALGVVVAATGTSGACLDKTNVEIVVKKNEESVSVQVN